MNDIYMKTLLKRRSKATAICFTALKIELTASDKTELRKI